MPQYSLLVEGDVIEASRQRVTVYIPLEAVSPTTTQSSPTPRDRTSQSAVTKNVAEGSSTSSSWSVGFSLDDLFAQILEQLVHPITGQPVRMPQDVASTTRAGSGVGRHGDDAPSSSRHPSQHFSLYIWNEQLEQYFRFRSFSDLPQKAKVRLVHRLVTSEQTEREGKKHPTPTRAPVDGLNQSNHLGSSFEAAETTPPKQKTSSVRRRDRLGYGSQPNSLLSSPLPEAESPRSSPGPAQKHLLKPRMIDLQRRQRQYFREAQHPAPTYVPLPSPARTTPASGSVDTDTNIVAAELGASNRPTTSRLAVDTAAKQRRREPKERLSPLKPKPHRTTPLSGSLVLDQGSPLNTPTTTRSALASDTDVSFYISEAGDDLTSEVHSLAFTPSSSMRDPMSEIGGLESLESTFTYARTLEEEGQDSRDFSSIPSSPHRSFASMGGGADSETYLLEFSADEMDPAESVCYPVPRPVQQVQERGQFGLGLDEERKDSFGGMAPLAQQSTRCFPLQRNVTDSSIDSFVLSEAETEDQDSNAESSRTTAHIDRSESQSGSPQTRKTSPLAQRRLFAAQPLTSTDGSSTSGSSAPRPQHHAGSVSPSRASSEAPPTVRRVTANSSPLPQPKSPMREKAAGYFEKGLETSTLSFGHSSDNNSFSTTPVYPTGQCEFHSAKGWGSWLKHAVLNAVVDHGFSAKTVFSTASSTA